MKKLSDYITSDYVSAANTLQGHNVRRRIVAYVESYDDVLFWRLALSAYEDATRYFEVMLPTRQHLNKGKKQAILSMMASGAGADMIACVDADYDYLLADATNESRTLRHNPYIVHTHVYAIENYQCYAPSLHNVCVMATLNDHALFDFQAFLAAYSRAVFPLFVWSIMIYRRREFSKFTITDFNKVIGIRHGRLAELMPATEAVRRKVRAKVQELQRRMPGMKEEYLATRDSLAAEGVVPDNVYLFIQGHHLFDNIVAPTLQVVCDELRREREREIRRKACHVVQMQNELSAYNNSLSDITQMLKKNQGYTLAPQYRQVLADIERILTPNE